ncbi:site-2 protease family protein [Paenibacillus sp. BAC0078]
MKMNRLFAPLPLLLTVSLLCILTAILFPPAGKAIYYAAIIFSAILLSILTHESGHLLTGIVYGLKPQEMIIGPFHLIFNGRFPRLTQNHNWLSFGGTMRFAASSEDLKDMAFKWSRMSLGGPAASLLLSLLILILGQPLHIWTEWLFWISLAIGTATLIPFSNGASHSDGKLFSILIKKSARADLLMASVILQKDYLSERPPGNWNTRVIAAAARLLDSLPERTDWQLVEESELRLFLYYYFADKQQLDKALAYIRPIALSAHPSGQVPATRHMIDSFYAGYLLLHQPFGDTSRSEAESLINSLSKQEPYSYHKAWAAMLATQGKQAEAAEHLSQARLLLDRWFRPFGTYRFEQSVLAQIENRLQL